VDYVRGADPMREASYVMSKALLNVEYEPRL
jgi:hypothetical protein